MQSTIYSRKSLRIQLLAMAIQWHIGDVVRKLRAEKGWNQQTFGKKAGMNKATVVTLENTPEETKTETVTKAARTLGLSVQQLYALVPEGGAVPALAEVAVQVGAQAGDVRVLTAPPRSDTEAVRLAQAATAVNAAREEQRQPHQRPSVAAHARPPSGMPASQGKVIKTSTGKNRG